MRLNGGLAAWIVVALLVVSLGFALGCTGGGGGEDGRPSPEEPVEPDEPGEPGEPEEPGDEWISPGSGMEFRYIGPLGIWVGRYEVTNAQYRLKEPGHDSGEYEGVSLNGERQPAVQVNFDDAREYAQWLTELDGGVLAEGFSYRLPDEDEWLGFAQVWGREYPWGNEWPPVSGQAGNYRDETHEAIFGVEGIPGYDDGHAVSAPVDELWVNPWGLAGVGGNVWEICASDEAGESFGAWRGASWYNRSQVDLRCSSRVVGDSSGRGGNGGFRLVLSR